MEKDCLAKPTRMEILNEWQAGEKPWFQRAPFSANTQRTFQTKQGFSGMTALGMLGMQLLEWAPCLGLLSTLPYFVKLGSPHPRPVECSSQSFIAHMLKPLCNKRK